MATTPAAKKGKKGQGTLDSLPEGVELGGTTLRKNYRKAIVAEQVDRQQEIAKQKTMGRPSSYTDAMADEICRRIMGGLPLSKVCLADDMPSRDTVHRWLVAHDDFSDKYVRACSIRREYRFETLEDVVDKEEDPARARIKVDVIKWQLSKEEPKKYGDKLDLTSDGKQLPQPIISLTTAPEQEQIDG